MNPGQLRNKIEFIGVTATANNIGGFTVTEAAPVEAWAKIDALTGNRALNFDGLQNTQQFVVTTRNFTSITTKFKVRFGDFDHAIHSIERPFENKNEMVLTVYRKFT